jgi:hypothetical protein
MTDPSLTAIEPRELPPIRIHHFLAWIAVMAVMLALSSSRPAASSPRVFPALQTAFVAVRAVGSVIGSLAITLLLFGIYWYRQGLPFFCQPGQWLIVTIAAPLLLTFVGQGLTQIVRFSGGIELSPFVTATVVWVGVMIFGVALNVYVARTKIHLQAWRRVFYWKAVACVVPLLGDLAVALVLERAVRANRRNHPLRQTFAPEARTAAPAIVQYHWTHQAGVALQFLHIALIWVIAFAVIGMMIYGTK